MGHLVVLGGRCGGLYGGGKCNKHWTTEREKKKGKLLIVRKGKKIDMLENREGLRTLFNLREQIDLFKK